MKKQLAKLLAVSVILPISAAAQLISHSFHLSTPEARTATANGVLSEITLKIDWDKRKRAVNPISYGVNCPACFDPNWTHNPALLRPLATITAGAKPLIRLHGWGMIAQGSNENWLNPDNTWNAEKIKSALAPLVKAGYRLMIDIPAGPRGEKDPVDPEAMAPFIAGLVKIVNVDNKFGVKYWELPNEREHILTAPQMAELLSKASKAMKKIDPGILVGGPAMESVNIEYLVDVVQRGYPDIDFVTVHTYGGDGKQSPDISYKSAITAINDVRALRERLGSVTKEKYLPIFVDEYNIGWDPNPDIYTHLGAVYFSIIQTGVIESGGDVSAVWDFSPPHGMSVVDRNGNLTASGNLFTVMNRYFYGEVVTTQLSNPSGLRTFAVKSRSTHAILLSNLTDSPLRVFPQFAGWQGHRFDQYEITASGYSAAKGLDWNGVAKRGIRLEGRSVTALVFR